MTKLVSCTAALALAFASFVSAHADTLTVKIVNGGSQLYGSFSIDMSASSQPGTFNFYDGNSTHTFLFSDQADGGYFGPDEELGYLSFQNVAGDVLNLDYHTALDLQTTLSICSTTSPCTFGGDTLISTLSTARGDIFTVTQGDFQVSSQTAVTPEPSTFALLGTGLLGAVGSVRRRIRRS
jgi:hypothetical protein